MDVEAALRDFFTADHHGAAVVYLFGSVARRTATRRSDVDVGVLFEKDPPKTLAGLHVDLAQDLEAVLRRRVDLVILNWADADLVHRVLRDGRLILDRDPSARIRFEVRKRNEYFDLFPFLQRYRDVRP